MDGHTTQRVRTSDDANVNMTKVFFKKKYFALLIANQNLVVGMAGGYRGIDENEIQLL